MKKIHRYIVADPKMKLWAIRESLDNIAKDFRDAGYLVGDYTGQEISANDYELMRTKGFTFDPSGAFLEVHQ